MTLPLTGPRAFLARGRQPIGVCLGVIGSDARWWLESARRLETAGYAGIWAWDHFIGRGDRSRPVLECWTMLAMAAGSTTRVGVGSFVENMMNRHPAVLARMVSTLQAASEGRAVLGIGIGGHEAEHEAYGIPFPDVPERVRHLEEAVAVIRALWTGGPVTRPSPYYPLIDAVTFPTPAPPPPTLLHAERSADPATLGWLVRRVPLLHDARAAGAAGARAGSTQVHRQRAQGVWRRRRRA